MALAPETLIELTADIVSAHVANNSVAISDIAKVIQSVSWALTSLGTATAPIDAPQLPAVSIRSSVKPDYIVCLEDGKKLKMLKRHLMTHYQMTPDDYRTKWKLPADYPMVSPDYAQTRKELALRIGLGRKRKVAVEAPATPAPKAKRGRPAKA